jgi:hypothetical protein
MDNIDNCYQETDAVSMKFHLIYSTKTFDLSKVLFSSFHFKQVPDSVGLVETYKKHTDFFVAGRHMINGDLCIKGAGINTFYTSVKKRDVLGGMTLRAATKEIICSKLLKTLSTIDVFSIGFLEDHPKHFFCIRGHEYPRLSAYLFGHSNKMKQLDTKKINVLWENILIMLDNGILHSSLNSDNINCGGQVIDCEGFFRAKSNAFVSLPFTFESEIPLDTIELDFQSLTSSTILKFNYLGDLYKLLLDVGGDEEHFAKLGGKVLDIAKDPRCLKADEFQVSLIKERYVNSKYLYYVEIELLDFILKDSIPGKEYIRFCDTKIFQNLASKKDSLDQIKLFLKKVLG